LVLLGGSHAGCSSEGSAGDEADAGETTSVKSEALTLAPINANADTSVRQAFPFSNDGIGVHLGVSSVAGSEQRSLIRFDQAAIAAAVGTQSVYSAHIELTITGFSEGWGGGQLSIHRMTRSWPEGNGTLSPPGSRGPTWTCADDSNTGNFVQDCTTANLWGMNSGDPNPLPFNTTASDTSPLCFFCER